MNIIYQIYGIYRAKIGFRRDKIKKSIVTFFVINNTKNLKQSKFTANLAQIRNICPVSFLESVLTHSNSSQYFVGPPPDKPWLLTDVGSTVITVLTAPYSHISLPTFFYKNRYYEAKNSFQDTNFGK